MNHWMDNPFFCILILGGRDIYIFVYYMYIHLYLYIEKKNSKYGKPRFNIKIYIYALYVRQYVRK